MYSHSMIARDPHEVAIQLIRMERTEGIEPPSSPWSGGALPLSYVRVRMPEIIAVY
jgi:hypothetical protein